MGEQPRQVVAALLINEQSQILLAKRSPCQRRNPGLWEFPGGQVNSGESFEEAIIREIHEELGIEIKEPRYFGKVLNKHRDPDLCLNGLIAQVEQSTDFVLQDHSEVCWKEAEEIMSLPDLIPLDIELLRVYLKSLKKD